MDTQHHDFDDTEVIEKLKNLPLHEVPDGLTDRIMARIVGKKPGIVTRIYRQINRPFTISFRPVYAFCLVILVGGAFLLGREASSPLLSPSETAAKAQTAYLDGRGLLATDNGNLALPLLQRAALLDPGNPEYAYWEGVGYWVNGNWQQERRSYLRGLASAPESVPLLINLGHSYLGEKKYEQALEAYKGVLSLSPGEAVARYNSGLIYRKLNLVNEEIGAWKAYLKSNRTGKWAFRAVDRLNSHGDYSYRPYRIGVRKVILSPERLLDDSLSEKKRRGELASLVAILDKNSRLKLEIVVFVEHDLEMAREKAQDIKKLIIGSAETDVNNRVKLSWFDKPEIIEVRNFKSVELAEGLLLFSILTPINGMEVSI